MNLITIEQAIAHCKADSDDTAMLTVYADAAEEACARAANRNLYKDQAVLTAALVDIPVKMQAAWDAYDAAEAAASALTDERAKEHALLSAQTVLNAARDEQDRVQNGIVVTPAIIAAVLLTTGHYYRNREEVVTGQGAAAVKLPMGADAIMSHYRWIGPL